VRGVVRRASGESGKCVSTAAFGELLKRPRCAAVDGVVSECEFVQGMRVLAVDDAARDRLRHELVRLGLRVGDLGVHVDIDSHFGEKVVGGNEKKRESPCPAGAKAVGEIWGC